MSKPPPLSLEFDEIDLERGGADNSELAFAHPPLPSSAPPPLSTAHDHNPQGKVVQQNRALYDPRDAQGMHAIYSNEYDKLQQLIQNDEGLIKKIQGAYDLMIHNQDEVTRLVARSESNSMGDLNGGAPQTESIFSIPPLPYLYILEENNPLNGLSEKPSNVDTSFNYGDKLIYLRAGIQFMEKRKENFNEFMATQQKIIGLQDRAIAAGHEENDQVSIHWFYELLLCRCCCCCGPKNVQDTFQQAFEDLQHQVQLAGGTLVPDMRQAEDSGIIFG